jgi:hypothetical protein
LIGDCETDDLKYDALKTTRLGIQEGKDVGKNSSIILSKVFLLKAKFDNSYKEKNQ